MQQLGTGIQVRSKFAQPTWVPTTEFELACAKFGSCRKPRHNEPVELIGTAGIRAVLGIASMRNDHHDQISFIVEQQQRAREIEVEHARLVATQGTLKANAWRDSQNPVMTRTPTAEELDLRKADQVVEAGLQRIVSAIHASIQNDGAFHDAPLVDPEQWGSNGDGRYSGPRPTLGEEYRRRLTQARNLTVAAFAESTRHHDATVNARPLQAPQPVNLKMLLPLYAIPAHMVQSWLADADVIEGYSLSDLWSE
jgi:hypothetical protein